MNIYVARSYLKHDRGLLGSVGIHISPLRKLKSVLDLIEIGQRASRKGASADLCWPGTQIGYQ